MLDANVPRQGPAADARGQGGRGGARTASKSTRRKDTAKSSEVASAEPGAATPAAPGSSLTVAPSAAGGGKKPSQV